MKVAKIGRSTGFTLLEVVCALAILICLFGGAYGIANGALLLSRSSNEAVLQEVQLNNLDAMLRRAFEELPVSTQFELETTDEGERLTLVTEKGSAPFQWHRNDALAERVVLRLESDSGNKGLQRLALEHWRSSGAGPLESIGSLRLLGGLTAARWRLFGGSENRWEEIWAVQTGRPLFVELTFELTGQPGERRMVFWVPSYQMQVPVPGANRPTP
ncbi:MAG: hypothetical protein DVB23_002001 [Verrucomicrobia bacterium]|jgi:hypothetical protein|nr:MAG: hypothetical protein DVB23_002001 [Verrucomicrobiota bacterium]